MEMVFKPSPGVDWSTVVSGSDNGTFCCLVPLVEELEADPEAFLA